MLPQRIANRRSWIWASAALLVVTASALGASAPIDGHKPSSLALVYVGADDCAPCQSWRRQHRPRFAATPEFARLDYHEIVAPRLLDLRRDEHWPEELAALRHEFARQPGAPTWFVLGDGELVATARGVREWEQVALPRIRRLAR